MAPFPREVDSWNFCSLVCPLVALTVNVLTQVAMVRARKGVQFLRCVLEAFSAGLVALAIIEVFLLRSDVAPPGAWIISWLVNAPTYAALSFCYFGFVNLGNTSIRIRLYAEIAEKPDGMTIEEIGQLYNEKAFQEMRLRRLLDAGDVIERDGRYFIGRRRLANVANILVAVRCLILGRPSEFAEADDAAA